MATGTDIGSVLDVMYPGLGLTDPQKLVAVNAALRVAWPKIKVITRTDEAGTLSDGTYDYSLSAITDLAESGVAQVFVNADNTPNLPLTHWSQYKDSSGYWHIVVLASTASTYNGKTFDVRYERRPVELTALSGTLEAPQAFVENYALWWVAMYALSAQSHITSKAYELQIPVWEKQWKQALDENMVLPLPRTHKAGLIRGPVTPA